MGLHRSIFADTFAQVFMEILYRPETIRRIDGYYFQRL